MSHNLTTFCSRFFTRFSQPLKTILITPIISRNTPTSCHPVAAKLSESACDGESRRRRSEAAEVRKAAGLAPSGTLQVTNTRSASAIEIVLEKRAEELGAEKRKEGSKKCLAKELKANLCVGINNVSRVLERMPAKPALGEKKRLKTVGSIVEALGELIQPKRANFTPLQAVIVAMDVQPKALVAHLGVLCASRGVLMLPIRGGDGNGSLKLGEVLGTRTAIAIGIKEGDTPINWAMESILEEGAK